MITLGILGTLAFLIYAAVQRVHGFIIAEFSQIPLHFLHFRTFRSVEDAKMQKMQVILNIVVFPLPL
jgi:hypothetical protein